MTFEQWFNSRGFIGMSDQDIRMMKCGWDGRGAARRADRGEPKGVDPREGNPSSSALASEDGPASDRSEISEDGPKREPVTANTEGQPRADEASRSTGCWDALDRK